MLGKKTGQVLVLGDYDGAIETALNSVCSPRSHYTHGWATTFEVLCEEAAAYSATYDVTVAIFNTAGRDVREMAQEIAILRRGEVEGLSRSIPIILVQKSGKAPRWAKDKGVEAVRISDVMAVTEAVRTALASVSPPTP
ncbi:MAG: hypothetical protein Q8M92_10820 [Candidatus Subteraquimicrobiales bacterium]|nr:hypothetical protein [Candidatus Subteraquimicrobiales bacterium]